MEINLNSNYKLEHVSIGIEVIKERIENQKMELKADASKKVAEMKKKIDKEIARFETKGVVEENRIQSEERD